jgi:folylpolyglutamate synthase
VVGITSLGLDHTSLLGNTVELIAWQKAGIMKPSVPAFSVQNQPGDSLKVMQQRAKEIGVSLFFENLSCISFVYLQCQLTVVPALSDYEWQNSVAPKLGVDSQVQNLNASLAIQLAHSWLSQSQGHVKGTSLAKKFMLMLAKL